MAVSATLVKNCFNAPKNGWVNLYLDTLSGISVPNPGIANGTALTVTTPSNETIVLNASEILNNVGVRGKISTVSFRKNHLILRKGWTVTG